MSSLHQDDPEVARPSVPTQRSDSPKAKLASASVDDIPELGQGDAEGPVGALPVPPVVKRRAGLQRALSARQVSMIAIGGTIGTGLFLGTGRSLAQGGPASMLLCYGIVGFIVYITLLLLGEMATQYPVAGESFGLYFESLCPRYLLSTGLSYLVERLLTSCQGPSTHTPRVSFPHLMGSHYLGIIGSTTRCPLPPI